MPTCHPLSDLAKTHRSDGSVCSLDPQCAIGIGYEGNVITSVKPGSQAESAGVHVGMRISELHGQAMSENSHEIKAKLQLLRASSTPFTMLLKT